MKKGIIATLSLVLLIAVLGQAQAVQYTYDEQHRLTRAEYSNGTVIEFTYDQAGNRLTHIVQSDRPEGDIDGDNDLDWDDGQSLLQALDTCTGDSGYLPAADLDGDGCITVNDYRIMHGLATE